MLLVGEPAYYQCSVFLSHDIAFKSFYYGHFHGRKVDDTVFAVKKPDVGTYNGIAVIVCFDV